MSEIKFKTNAEWVKAYETAIAEVLEVGQSYSIAGRQFTMADLGKLEEMKNHYLRLVQDEANGETFYFNLNGGFR